MLHGENPETGDLTPTTWGTYFWYTIFLNIICLNLLIAILSNTYDNVQTSLDSTIYKIQAEILLEVARFKFWVKDCQDLVYLHIVNKHGEKLSGDTAQDEWTGRVRVMTDKLDAMKHTQLGIKEEQKDMKKVLKAMDEKIIAINDKITTMKGDTDNKIISMQEHIMAAIQELKA